MCVCRSRDRASHVRRRDGLGGDATWAVRDERNTVRLKDRADAEALKERFGIPDDRES